MSVLTIIEGAAAATPAAAKVAIYAKADGLVYSKDDAGTETQMSSAEKLVPSVSASASSSISFDGAFAMGAGYDYIIRCREVKNSIDADCYLQYGTGATPTYQTTGYTNQVIQAVGAVSTEQRDGITTAIIAQIGTAGGGASAGETWDATFEISNPAANQLHKTISTIGFLSTDGLIRWGAAAGMRTTAEVITGLKIFPSTGTFTTGIFYLYRRKLS